jgi:hypothetical protein
MAFRRSAVELARDRLSRGVTLAQVAREIGLTTPSLARWLQPPAAPVLRPVALAPEPRQAPPPAAGLVLVTRQGLRVEGLDREALITVLRALA